MKKIVGAKRRSLFMQFVAESWIFCFAAPHLALDQMALPLSSFYFMLVGDVSISFSSPVLWSIIGGTLLAITIINGIYPALLLSSFHPMNVMKGMSLAKIKDSSLRKGLVIFQFALSATLIISVAIIYLQMRYVQTMNPGYQKEHIVNLKMPNSIYAQGWENAEPIIQTIKGELQSRTEIVNISINNGTIHNIKWQSKGGFDWNGRADDYNPPINVIQADENFMEVYNLQLTDGRWFEHTDRQNFILNETAIRELHIQEPVIGQPFEGIGYKGTIIGIVKDFHFRSLHEQITPLLIGYASNNSSITVKTQAGKAPEAIAAIESVWGRFFPNDPFEFTFLDDSFNQLYQADIHTSRLMLTFSILAVVIAVLGLFGLSTFAIERRTKEIGIRKVLGASVTSIIHLLTRDFLILVAIAFVIAAPVAWWVMSRWLENFAYHIQISVWIFVAGAIVVLCIALIAIGIQAVRAATENPVKSILSCD
jgi:ABC-type antimicrobial peptide transport system permease subunit